MTDNTTGLIEETGHKRYFGLNLAELIANKITATHPRFPAETFIADAKTSNLTSLLLPLIGPSGIFVTLFSYPRDPMRHFYNEVLTDHSSTIRNPRMGPDGQHA